MNPRREARPPWPAHGRSPATFHILVGRPLRTVFFAERRHLGRLQVAFSSVGDRISVPPDASVSQARRGPSPDAAQVRVRQRRPGSRPRPRIVDACAALAGLGGGAVLAAVITGESRGSLAAPGGLLIAAGRFAGFTGTYLMLIMVMLVARLPWLERSAGQDQLVRWHRRVSPWALGLIAAHAVLVTLGYAQAAKTGALRELWVLVRSYPDMLAAVAGSGLLVLAGVTSYRMVRQRLRYETWWVVHLYFYLALALAFAHQIVTGVSFIGHPLVRALWIVIWAATAGMVLVFRVRAAGLAEPAPPASGGRGPRRGAGGGVGGLPGRAAGPARRSPAASSSSGASYQGPVVAGAPVLAVGAAAAALPAGDHQGARRPEPRGSPPAARHPGRHRGALRRVHPPRPHPEGVAAVGAGVGITPLRALLEDLPAGTDVVVVVRASTAADLVHRGEVAALVRQRGGRLHEMVGPRHRVRLDARTLPRIVPDIAARDVYICGPGGFSSEIAEARLAARGGGGADPHRNVRILGLEGTDEIMHSCEGWRHEAGADRDHSDRGRPHRRAGVPHPASPGSASVASARGRGAAAGQPGRRRPGPGGRAARGSTPAGRGQRAGRDRGRRSARRSTTTGASCRSRSLFPGRKILKVGIASIDDGGNPRSQSIDQQSIPILEQEALQAQSANIQGVSGCELHQRRIHPVAPVGAAQLSFRELSSAADPRTARPVHHLENVMGTIVTIDVYASRRGTAAEIDEISGQLEPAPGPSSSAPTRSSAPGSRQPDQPAAAGGDHRGARPPRRWPTSCERCAAARELSGGWFDPWAMPGGVDPTGYVKGWAAQKALAAFSAPCIIGAMVNAAGDIASSGGREPASRSGSASPIPLAPRRLAEIVELTGAIATSGSYERGSHLIDPHRAAWPRGPPRPA